MMSSSGLDSIASQERFSTVQKAPKKHFNFHTVNFERKDDELHRREISRKRNAEGDEIERIEVKRMRLNTGDLGSDRKNNGLISGITTVQTRVLPFMINQFHVSPGNLTTPSVPVKKNHTPQNGVKDGGTGEGSSESAPRLWVKKDIVETAVSNSSAQNQGEVKSQVLQDGTRVYYKTNVAGKREGQATAFLPNGTLLHYNYVNGVPQGNVVEIRGDKTMLTYSLLRGKKHGGASVDYPGKYKMVYNYVFGIKDGSALITHPDGAQYMITFRNDVRDGKVYQLKNSDSICVGEYKNGVFMNQQEQIFYSTNSSIGSHSQSQAFSPAQTTSVQELEIPKWTIQIEGSYNSSSANEPPSAFIPEQRRSCLIDLTHEDSSVTADNNPINTSQDPNGIQNASVTSLVIEQVQNVQEGVDNYYESLFLDDSYFGHNIF